LISRSHSMIQPTQDRIQYLGKELISSQQI